VVSVEIDRSTGALATPSCPPEQVASEWFLSGTEPTEYCPVHEQGLDSWLRRRMRDVGGWFRGGGR
jgi:hypothetical protein